MRTNRTIIYIFIIILFFYSPIINTKITIDPGKYQMCSYVLTFNKSYPFAIFNFKTRSSVRLELMGNKANELLKVDNKLPFLLTFLVENKSIKKEVVKAKLLNFGKCDAKKALFYVGDNFKPLDLD